jgi:hypothetical protein
MIEASASIRNDLALVVTILLIVILVGGWLGWCVVGGIRFLWRNSSLHSSRCLDEAREQHDGP